MQIKGENMKSKFLTLGIQHFTESRLKGLKFWKRNKIAYFFLLPWIIGLVMFAIIPILMSLYLSFTDFSLFQPGRWIGLMNYITMFAKDPRWVKSCRVTFTYVLIGVPLQLTIGLFLALLLNKGIPGLSTFRAIYYLPSLIGGSVAIAVLWRQVFGIEGIFNKLLLFCGITAAEGISWIANPNYAIYSLILLLLWQFGSPMIIFLAGLRQIPQELYEVASIDGAGKMRKFLKITIPLLTPVIFFNLVMQTIFAFQSFTPAYILGGVKGGVLDSLLFYSLYLYIKGFTEFRMGFACAQAWGLFLIIVIFASIYFATSKQWVYYEHR